MNISAKINSSFNQHDISVQTDGDSKMISISPKSSGYGSSINGGELLLLSLATCFCNDLYREAKKRNIPIDSIEVECAGNFGAEGETGSNFQYKANLKSPATRDEIDKLIAYTDQIAEVHNTLRRGIQVTLNK